METPDSPRTRFDDSRDALARGDAAAAAAYPAPALAGLRLFVGEGRCNLCHLGPAFTNGEFHDAGRPFMAAPGRPDPGRHGGVRAVLADPHNRLGRWSDAPAAGAGGPDPAVRTRHLAPSHRNFGEFRVPGLRGIVATAPYGHDGAMATLDDVVAHYSELDVERLHADGEALLRPLRLDARRRGELVAFLESLSAPARPPLRSALAAPMSGAQECKP
jgi:cytochrome c peroxidase